jgi:2-hydroxychromene-2-carboxylate isomerase
MSDVLLWSDYKSPYAFIAKAWAYELEADYEIDLRWRPYTLDIPSYLDSVEDRTPHHWRRVRYSYSDARRYANKQGLILRGPQKVFASRPAQIGMLYAQAQGVFRRYNDLAFERFWQRAFDVESIDAVAALLGEAGAPAAGFAAFAEGEGGAEHDRLRDEAEASGVFGVPTFVLDGELFWGGDRIDLLRERLDEKGVKRRTSFAAEHG